MMSASGLQRDRDRQGARMLRLSTLHLHMQTCNAVLPPLHLLLQPHNLRFDLFTERRRQARRRGALCAGRRLIRCGACIFPRLNGSELCIEAAPTICTVASDLRRI